MELQDYLRVLRKRWQLVAVVTLITIGGAALATILSPKVYSAETQFFVSTSGGDNADQLYSGSFFTQQRVKSYSQLIETPKVLGPVIEKLHLEATSDHLSVNATVPLDTVLIDVTVTDRDAAQAALVAKTLGEQFPATIADLEKVNTDKPSPVKVTVVQPAQESTSPISPKPSRNLALGLVLGLLLGFGAALLRDMLDTTIKSPRDLEGVSEETVIGTISFDPDASAHPLLLQIDPKSQRAEAFRSLRTNLQFVDAASHPRSIVVTSSLPGEGKTTTAANLALTLAAAGSRVCIVEGDLRRPRLLEYLGYEGAVGLTDVLIRRADLHDVLQQFGDTSLWVLGAGGIPPNPSELLGSAVMKETLTALEERFDYVFIDAPPLLPVTDAAVLSTHVGGALVVVGAGVINKDHLRRALDTLEAVNGNVLGLVLNRLPRKESGGYGYGYRYDYSSSPTGKRSEPSTVDTPSVDVEAKSPAEKTRV